MKKYVLFLIALIMFGMGATIIYATGIDYREQWASKNKEFKLVEKQREIYKKANAESDKFTIYKGETLTISNSSEKIEDLKHIKVNTTDGKIGYISLEELYNFFEGQSDNWLLKVDRYWQTKVGELPVNIVIISGIICLMLILMNNILDNLLFKLPWIPATTIGFIDSLAIKLMPGWLFGLFYTGCFIINQKEHAKFIYKGFNLIPTGYEHPIHWIMYLSICICLIIAIVVTIDNFMSFGVLAGTFKFIQLIYLNISCIFIAMIGSFTVLGIFVVYILFSIISNIRYVEVRR